MIAIRAFNFEVIIERKIQEAMSEFKLKKVFNKGDISGQYLKIAFPLISRIFTLLLNISIETSTFPFYLSNIKQYCRFNGVESNMNNIEQASRNGYA